MAIGAKQLVVHDAFERIVSSPVMLSSLTPKTTVGMLPFAGAEITTFLAPAFKCPPAPSSSTNLPVDSRTTSTPSSPQGRLAGSLSA